MLIPSASFVRAPLIASLSRRVNANSQPRNGNMMLQIKLIKKGEC